MLLWKSSKVIGVRNSDRSGDGCLFSYLVESLALAVPKLRWELVLLMDGCRDDELLVVSIDELPECIDPDFGLSQGQGQVSQFASGCPLRDIEGGTHPPEMGVFCSRIDGLRLPAMLNLVSVMPRENEGALEVRFACGAAFCSRLRDVPSASETPRLAICRASARSSGRILTGRREIVIAGWIGSPRGHHS